MQQEIIINENNVCTYVGNVATKASYNPRMRRIIDNIYKILKNNKPESPKVWVYEYNPYTVDLFVLRAAQSSVINAMEYMTNDNRVLIRGEF